MKAFYPQLNQKIQYDPANIQYSHQADFIYSTLERVFYLDNESRLKSHCLQSQSYENGLWKLVFKSSLKTSQGKRWGAKDFYLSLKRLILLEKDLHHNIAKIINFNKDLNTLEDELEEISLEDENTILFKVNSIQKEILEEMFATHESSILYRESFDHRTLKIKDYDNTTGSYYLSQKSPNVLLCNKNYIEQNALIEKINLVPIEDYKDLYQKFIESDVDILKSVNIVDSSEIYNKAKDNQDLRLNIGSCFDLITLKFNKDSDLPLEKRIGLAKAFKELYLNRFFINGFNKQAEQFFPESSLFSLPSEDIEEYQNLINESSLTTGDGIRFKVKSEAQRDFLISLTREALPNLVFTTDNTADVSLSSTDTGAHETYSPIIYFTSIGMFDLKDKKEEILSDFSQVNKEERQKIGQKIHKEALMKAQVFPILFSPRISLAKKPYKFTNRPELIWNITKEK